MIFSLNRNIDLQRRMITNTFYYLICKFIHRKIISEDKKLRRTCQNSIHPQSGPKNRKYWQKTRHVPTPNPLGSEVLDLVLVFFRDYCNEAIHRASQTSHNIARVKKTSLYWK
jgi:hypothetical protein